jgi:SAM-dependent methyltransferase
MTTKINQESDADVRTYVRESYGKRAAEFQPSERASCCGPDDSDSFIPVTQLYEAPDVLELPAEVSGLSMGCGDPITLASLQPGQTVLDLGSGGGIDCFLAAKRVGDTGKVIGVDMTAEMIEKARANKAKLDAQNVDFRLGEIEHLPVADGMVDVIISNCVINLSPDKEQVFREAYRVLRPGGRIAVSDIVTDGPLPAVIKDNLSAWAGCIAGALDVNEYIGGIEAAGFEDVQLTPVYWDQSMINDAAEHLDFSADAEGGCCRLVVDDGTGPEVIALDPAVEIDEEKLRKAIFSAKITARKPLV